jgi:hypothetical protein
MPVGLREQKNAAGLRIMILTSGLGRVAGTVKF